MSKWCLKEKHLHFTLHDDQTLSINMDTIIGSFCQVNTAYWVSFLTILLWDNCCWQSLYDSIVADHPFMTVLLLTFMTVLLLTMPLWQEYCCLPCLYDSIVTDHAFMTAWVLLLTMPLWSIVANHAFMTEYCCWPLWQPEYCCWPCLYDSTDLSASFKCSFMSPLCWHNRHPQEDNQLEEEH